MVQNVGMNKRDLAKAVAVHSDVDLSTVSKVLDGFTDVVTSIVSKGEPVLLTGFAKFTKVERAARMGRNPATGEQIHIKASKRARITPAKTFKDAVLAPSKAPKLARGVWPIDADAVKRAGAVAAAPAKKAAATKTTARRAPAKAVAKRAVAKKRAVTKRATATKRAVAKKRPAVAKRAVAKRAVAKKRTAVRRAAPVAKKRAVKKVASRSAAKRAPRRGR
jgi:DNA-binding protein HU-beta